MLKNTGLLSEITTPKYFLYGQPKSRKITLFSGEVISLGKYFASTTFALVLF